MINKKQRDYTSEELKFIKDNYLEMSDEQLASKLKRSVGSVTRKRSQQGLTR